jgi:hypothetical protein
LASDGPSAFPSCRAVATNFCRLFSAIFIFKRPNRAWSANQHVPVTKTIGARSEQTKTSSNCPDFSPQTIWSWISNLASRKSAASVFVVLLRTHEFEFVKFPLKQSLNWSVSIASSQCFTSDWRAYTPVTPHNHATKISASNCIPKTRKVNILNMWLLYHKILREENKKPPQLRGFRFNSFGSWP